jgi:hypothetical protein
MLIYGREFKVAGMGFFALSAFFAVKMFLGFAGLDFGGINRRERREKDTAGAR